ncbi:MAG: hypothetical protein KDB26_08875 [Microthrixaceae bacterium]|nr:hypothetical protein [Microthrixaceae bacterium]
MPLDGYPHTWTQEDVANPYDPSRFTDSNEEFVWCRILVTFPSGETRTCTGDYLNAGDQTPVLRCGIEEAASELGLLHYLADERLYLRVCEEVDRQLSWRPVVLLSCPEFRIKLDLMEPQ